LLERPDLDGAFLDIDIGGTHSYPIARLLRSKGVPFIFVSGYEPSILPQDLRDATLISKPVFIGEITRVAVDRFSAPAGLRTQKRQHETLARAALLRSRIETGELRIRTQQRRLQLMQFRGHDPEGSRLTANLLDQMQIAIDLMKDTLRAIESFEPNPASKIERPISDDFIAASNDRDVHAWAARFGISVGRLRELIIEVGPSALAVRGAIDTIRMNGPAKKSHY
jgi:hypothetical protein